MSSPKPLLKTICLQYFFCLVYRGADWNVAQNLCPHGFLILVENYLRFTEPIQAGERTATQDERRTGKQDETHCPVLLHGMPGVHNLGRKEICPKEKGTSRPIKPAGKCI